VGLGRIGRVEKALPIEGRRHGAHDAIALGLVQGLLEAGLTEEAVRISQLPAGPDFSELLDWHDVWLQAAAVRCAAELSLATPDDGRALKERLAELELAAGSGAARLALLQVYSRHSAWEYAEDLKTQVTELTALRVDVASGKFQDAAEQVWRKPRGLARGVMLLQLADAEVQRRQKLLTNENWVPSSGLVSRRALSQETVDPRQ